jgi:Raf kinase inhibitor-like YbhB/YbcL family protein
MALEITSPAFKNNEFIPSKYTCQGEDVSPALAWSKAPAGTKDFVLIVDDPDAPMGDWVHWLVYNILTPSNSLQENIFNLTGENLPYAQGKTSFGTIGYGGPCPPPGKVHHYLFKIYALDTALNLPPGLSKQQLLKAIEGHVLAQAQLVGLYKR